jgi:fumarate hydratase class II
VSLGFGKEEMMTKMRIEKDSMGALEVPEDVLYGAQTARAVANFPVSGIGFPRPFIRALGLIKKNAATVNAELGLVDAEKARMIEKAAQEVIDGQLDEDFVVDIYQTGSGTSTNMNTNEVIATRARQLMGEISGKAIHPNDHVNFGQSSNDVVPTASNIAAAVEIKYSLIPALFELQEALGEKAGVFDDIVKIGRTHLQDATPIRLGQVFSGYARQVALSIRRIETAKDGLKELPLGGTAVGTGINTHPEFSRRVIRRIAEATAVEFREAENHFEAQGARDSLVYVSSALKTSACALYKIGNDIRFLGSGPRWAN